jgi:hypothetical protein
MGILDTVKDVASLVQKADNIELYQKILELQIQIMGLLEDNHSLRSELRNRQERSRFENGLEFRNNMYWHRLGPDKVDGPFCSKCWDAAEKAVRLQRLTGGMMWCPHCERSAPGTEPPSASDSRGFEDRDWETGY